MCMGFISIAACIGNSLHFTDAYYTVTSIYYAFKIYSPVGGLWGNFQFGTILIKVINIIIVSFYNNMYSFLLVKT